jgi:hypothetical protein
VFQPKNPEKIEIWTIYNGQQDGGLEKPVWTWLVWASTGRENWIGVPEIRPHE